MHCYRGRVIFVIFAACVWTAGCGVDTATLQKIQEVANRTQSNRSNLLGSSGRIETEPAVIATQEFTPPFPERQNPFVFPTGHSGEKRQASPISTDLQVLGFARIDEPTVLVRCNDEIKRLRLGDKVAGMTIVRIDEPLIEIQSGNLSWTATMFDRTSP